jgi:hypothetical protein
VVRALGLPATDVIKMAVNGIDSTFLSAESKDELRKRLRTAIEPFELIDALN